MPHGMSQCACANVDGRSQLVRRDMRTPRLSCRGRWPGDLAAGVGTGGRGRLPKCRSVSGACQTWRGEDPALGCDHRRWRTSGSRACGETVAAERCKVARGEGGPIRLDRRRGAVVLPDLDEQVSHGCRGDAGGGRRELVGARSRVGVEDGELSRRRLERLDRRGPGGLDHMGFLAHRRATLDLRQRHVMTTLHDCVGWEPSNGRSTSMMERRSLAAWNFVAKDGPVRSPAIEAHRALVLHDRSLVVDLISLTLNHGLFHVRAASSFAEARAIMGDWRPNVSVIDMDHDDSRALLGLLGASNAMRRNGTPVLALTRMGDLRTKLAAFELGVDDILTIPFSPEELLARAIVITRRALGVDLPLIPVIRLGEIEIDIVNREVRVGPSVVRLSPLEQSLVYLLASRAGRVVTHEEILDAVWGTDFIAESNMVDRHIRSLRMKLRDDYRYPRFIETVQNKGYRFIPDPSNTGWGGAPTASGHAPN